MVKPFIVVTNNELSKSEFEGKYVVDFVEGGTLDVFKKARDYVHKGHELLTHPLMSSIKPNETPFRTVLVSKSPLEKMDYQSLSYIEEGIHTTEKFLKGFGFPEWTEQVLEDFKVIDYDLIYHAIH